MANCVCVHMYSIPTGGKGGRIALVARVGQVRLVYMYICILSVSMYLYVYMIVNVYMIIQCNIWTAQGGGGSFQP